MNPWYKTTLPLKFRNHLLRLQVPHDVFSTQQIDDGTLLLLDHLPPDTPQTICDIGCGYGALGLPIAAAYPDAHVTLVDRDLLAVTWACQNAETNQLTNVFTYGSLGFANLRAEPPVFDWILCNVPARIGQPFMKYLLAGGNNRLSATGVLRLVVINDLGATIQEAATELSFPVTEIARGPRHAVFSLAAVARPTAEVPPTLLDLYRRDQVSVDGLLLDRPFDLGGDDPLRLAAGLPALLDALPRATTHNPPQRVLCFRCGYGQLPTACKSRWPKAQVVGIDRDLLGIAFTEANAQRLLAATSQPELRSAAHFPDGLRAGESFDLIIGELSPSAGARVAADELAAACRHLTPGGELTVLVLTRLAKEWLPKIASDIGVRIYRVLERDGYTISQITKPS